MRHRIVLFGLVGLLSLPITLQAQPLAGTASIDDRIRASRDTMAIRFQIVWPDTALPRVAIGWPDSIPTEADILRAVTYTYDPRTIWINPLAIPLNDSASVTRRYLHEVIRRQFGDFNPKLNHELTHDFYGLTYRRLTGRPRPLIKGDWYVANLLAHKLMSEGLATAVERFGMPCDTAATNWPVRVNLYSKDVLTMPEIWEDLCYEGGWKLLAPLLKEFGLTAVTEYVILHPLEFTSNAIRAELVVWRAQAYEDLRTQKTNQ